MYVSTVSCLSFFVFGSTDLSSPYFYVFRIQFLGVDAKTNVQIPVTNRWLLEANGSILAVLAIQTNVIWMHSTKK